MHDYLLVHFIVSFLIAVSMTVFLKNKFKDDYILIFVSILAINLLFIFVGYILTTVLSIFLVYSKKVEHLQHLQTFDREEFDKKKYPKVKRVFGEGAINSTLVNQNHSLSNKMKSVVFLSQQENRENYDLIKKGLSDESNEIRLYSFSILSSKEEFLNKKLSNLLNKYNDVTNVAIKSRLGFEIASIYWEFIYLGLTDSENELIILKKMEELIIQSLKESDKKAKLYTLLAKVYFKQNDFNLSSIYFQKAIDEGEDSSKLLPYLCEIAYEKRDFKQVKEYINGVDVDSSSPLIKPVIKQWNRAS